MWRFKKDKFYWRFSKIKTGESGMILLIAMFFVFILSLVALIAAQESSLLGKEVSYSKSRIVANVQVENLLHDKEQQLLNKHVLPPDTDRIYQEQNCPVTFYRLKAESMAGMVHEVRQSTVAIVGDTSNCNPKPALISGVKARW